MQEVTLKLRLPDDVTIGDLYEVQGTLVNLSTDFVDWEKLYNKETGGIACAGMILLALADAIKRIDWA